MKTWERVLLAPESTLREALALIDSTGAQVALVVDGTRRLLGTLSDGDVRRGLLGGLTLEHRATLAMNQQPTCVRDTDDRESVLALMRRKGLRQMPVVSAEGLVVGLQTMADYFDAPLRDNWVVVMAGGLGSRLAELTRQTPKPMLHVGGRPLLETIVRNFADQGFRRIYLAVNYKAEQIEAHFGAGDSLGVEIRYLRENERLGTAGALSLMPEPPTTPVLVTNADLLTKADFGDLVDAHVKYRSVATMAVRDYEMKVPFGVVRDRNGLIESVEEKPVHRFLVNAGMYVLSPEALKHIPQNQYFDMPTLFDNLRENGIATRCHRIHGYWLDIGRLGDYEKANQEFNEVFR